MNMTYIAIETNIERFEKYKTLWLHYGIIGIRAAGMTAGIEAAIAVESSKTDTLFFISIVSDEIPNFMQKLSILGEETTAPILIATSNYNATEHHKALSNGADFYGNFCDDGTENIDAVMAAVNSIQRRKGQAASKNIISYGGVVIAFSQRKIFVNDANVKLTRQELDILLYLMENRGKVLTYEQIYAHVWNRDYDDSKRELLRNAIKRLRGRLKTASRDSDYIETVRGGGYSFRLVDGEQA